MYGKGKQIFTTKIMLGNLIFVYLALQFFVFIFQKKNYWLIFYFYQLVFTI